MRSEAEWGNDLTDDSSSDESVLEEEVQVGHMGIGTPKDARRSLPCKKDVVMPIDFAISFRKTETDTGRRLGRRRSSAREIITTTVKGITGKPDWESRLNRVQSRPDLFFPLEEDGDGELEEESVITEPAEKDLESQSTKPVKKKPFKIRPSRFLTDWNHIVRQTFIRRIWSALFLLTATICFIVEYIRVQNTPLLYDLMGACICVSRGSAVALKFTIALILYFSCRGMLGLLGRRFPGVKNWFPLGDTLPLHRLIGTVTVILSVVHTMGHTCNIYRIAHCGKLETIQALFRDETMKNIPTQKELWSTTPAVTGLVMSTCIVLASILIPLRKRFFFNFWALHHLFLVMAGLLLFHGADLLFPRSAYKFCALPLVLYFIDRTWRYFQTQFILETPVIGADIVGSKDVLYLRLRRPRHFKFTPGSYALVMIPEISRFEWHPFSISSSPGDAYLTFHIQKVGDWTQKALTFFHAKISGIQDKWPVVRVYGPLGSPSQRWLKYDVVVFVVTGTRVTPYLSILGHMLETSNHPCKNIHFIWTSRDHNQRKWAQEIIQRFQGLESYKFSSEFYLTSSQHVPEEELLTADSPEWSEHRLHFGRPYWPQVFERVKNKYGDKNSEKTCGVFAGVPKVIGKKLSATAIATSENHFKFTYQAEYL
mmetsp:Transcript_9821/g.16074  ORF Transcript_9821/g.16074 Transcript_9821/m.16074 type:complete len:654 (+) Transcript_9821:158-2119(+)